MALETYTKATSFTSYQASNPTSPLPADDLDAELDNISDSIDSLIARLSAVTSDANILASGSVDYDQLSARLKNLFASTALPEEAQVYLCRSSSDPYLQIVESGELALNAETGLTLVHLGETHSLIEAVGGTTGAAVLTVRPRVPDGAGAEEIRLFHGAYSTGSRKIVVYRSTSPTADSVAHQIGVGADDPTYFDALSGARVGLGGMTDPKFAVDIGGTDALALPRGTTAERPASNLKHGLMRWNTTIGGFDVYTNTSPNWLQLGMQWAVSDATDGYIRDPITGFTIQWMVVAISANPTAVVFPLGFGNACRGVWLTANASSGRTATVANMAIAAPPSTGGGMLATSAPALGIMPIRIMNTPAAATTYRLFTRVSRTRPTFSAKQV